MKVIELLNKIANGEEVPERIKYVNREWFWCEGCKIYEQLSKEANRSNLYRYFADNGDLNDEVEIIEEDKKIEKLEIEPLNIKDDLQHQIETVHYENIMIANAVNEIIKRL